METKLDMNFWNNYVDDLFRQLKEYGYTSFAVKIKGTKEIFSLQKDEDSEHIHIRYPEGLLSVDEEWLDEDEITGIILQLYGVDY